MKGAQLGIINAKLQKESSEELAMLFTNDYAYEVIRLIDSKAIFLDLHFQRLEKTCKGLNYPLPDFDILKAEIDMLVAENSLKSINIKIIIQNENRAVFALESHYPCEEDYLRGVHCDLLFEERENPELKSFQAELRKKANEQIVSHKIFESVLVNREGLITEGSRSNLFFIKNKVLYTAPDVLVLGGITRLKVMEICKTLHLPLKLEAIPVATLKEYEAAFICGTSPGVLAIQTIKDYQFQADHSILKMIHEKYHRNYLNSYPYESR